MSFNDTMTNLMNAARVKFPLASKLGFSELTKLLLSKTLYDETIAMSGATADGKWQKYTATGNPTQIYPDSAYVSAKKGDTIYQAITLKTDGVFQSTFISFYQTGVGHHNVTPDVKKIDDSTIRLSASYTCDADGSYLMADLNVLTITGGTYYEVADNYAAISPVGGVTNPVLSVFLGFLPSRRKKVVTCL